LDVTSSHDIIEELIESMSLHPVDDVTLTQTTTSTELKKHEHLQQGLKLNVF